MSRQIDCPEARNEVAAIGPRLAGEPHSDAPESLRRRILVVTTLGYIGCFAVWTIFAIIGVEIQRQYGLSDTEFGLLLGLPFLSGSLMRVGSGCGPTGMGEDGSFSG